MAGELPAVGFTLGVDPAGGTSYTSLELTSFTFNKSVETSETTTLAVDQKKTIPVKIVKTADFEVNIEEVAFADLEMLMESLVIATWKIDYPTELSHVDVSFTGTLTSLAESYAVGSHMTASGTIEIND